MGDTQLRTERRREARPEPEPPRPLWPVRIVLLVVGVPLLLVVGLLVYNLLDRREITSTTIAGPVDRVVVQLARGDVQLVPVTDRTTDVVVETTLRWRFIRPESSAERSASGEVASLTGSCPRIVIILGTCAVDYVVQVPSGTQVYVRTDAGTVVAEGLDGWVRIVTSGGDVSATDMRSPEVLVESEGGAVDLEFTTSPSRVDVASEGGAVGIRVPDGATYDLRTTGSTGVVDAEVPTDREAERTMRIRSGDGTVTISAS